MLAQLLLLIVGAALVVAGVALVSTPVAFIVGGMLVSTFALLWDFGGNR